MKRWFKSRPLFFLITSIIISSCTLPLSKTPYAAGYVERGIASWYGDEFHGRPTSSGEIYDMYSLTAAHRLIPLGTIAKITNLENGQSVVVKINDRGPFVDGRIIDLSYSSAVELGMIETGLSRVEVEVLRWGEILSDFTVQVGSFLIEDNALRLKDQLSRKYPDVYVITYETKYKKFHRVRVGSTGDIREAEQLSERLSAEGFSFFITRKD